jgi:hypothetical protein
MDHKQRRVIDGWIQRASQEDDPYFQFISLWIAFNALCYALYHAEANQQRADLRKFDRGQAEDCDLDARLSIRADTIKVSTDTFRMSVTVGQRYTEDKIFSRWAKEMQVLYASALTEDTSFACLIDTLRVAIRKPNGCYVLNLSRKDSSEVDGWDEKRVITTSANVLYSFHDRQKLSLLKGVLYQIRCNIFHGEKVPGDANDDRIVRAATPVLQRLLAITLRSSEQLLAANS